MLLAGPEDGHWKRCEGVFQIMLLTQPSPCSVNASVEGTAMVEVMRYAPAGRYKTPP